MSDELNFNWKYKDYELRACPKRLAKLSGDEKNETIDFVKWQDYNGKKTCFSLAYFVRTSEGYDLKFVDNRPFEHIETEDLVVCWKALEMAQGVLDAWLGLSYYE